MLQNIKFKQAIINISYNLRSSTKIPSKTPKKKQSQNQKNNQPKKKIRKGKLSKLKEAKMRLRNQIQLQNNLQSQQQQKYRQQQNQPIQQPQKKQKSNGQSEERNADNKKYENQSNGQIQSNRANHQQQDQGQLSQFQSNAQQNYSESHPRQSIFGDSIFSSYVGQGSIKSQEQENNSKYNEVNQMNSDWKSVSDISSISESSLQDLSNMKDSQFSHIKSHKQIPQMTTKAFISQLKKLPNMQPLSKKQNKTVLQHKLMRLYNINLGTLYFHQVLEQFSRIIMDLRRDPGIFEAVTQLKSQIITICSYFQKNSGQSIPGSEAAKIWFKIKQIQSINILIKKSKQYKPQNKIQAANQSLLTPADHRYYSNFLFRLSQILKSLRKNQNLRKLSSKYKRKYLDVKLIQPIYLSKQTTDYMRYLYKLSEEDYSNYREWARNIIHWSEIKYQRKLNNKKQQTINKQNTQKQSKQNQQQINGKKYQLGDNLKSGQAIEKSETHEQKLCDLEKQKSVNKNEQIKIPEEVNQNTNLILPPKIVIEQQKNSTQNKQIKDLQKQQEEDDKKIITVINTQNKDKNQKKKKKKPKPKPVLNPLERALVVAPKHQVKEKRSQDQWVTQRFKGRDPKYLASYRYSEQYLASHPQQKQLLTTGGTSGKKKSSIHGIICDSSSSQNGDQFDIKPNNSPNSSQDKYKSDGQDSTNSEIFLQRQREALMQYVIKQSLEEGAVQFKRTTPRSVNHYGALEQSRNYQHSVIKNQMLKQKRNREQAIARERKNQQGRKNLFKLDSDIFESKPRKKTKLESRTIKKQDLNHYKVQAEFNNNFVKKQYTQKQAKLKNKNKMGIVDQQQNYQIGHNQYSLNYFEPDNSDSELNFFKSNSQKKRQGEKIKKQSFINNDNRQRQRNQQHQQDYWDQILNKPLDYRNQTPENMLDSYSQEHRNEKYYKNQYYSRDMLQNKYQNPSQSYNEQPAPLIPNRISLYQKYFQQNNLQNNNNNKNNNNQQQEQQIENNQQRYDMHKNYIPIKQPHNDQQDSPGQI